MALPQGCVPFSTHRYGSLISLAVGMSGDSLWYDSRILSEFWMCCLAVSLCLEICNTPRDVE